MTGAFVLADEKRMLMAVRGREIYFCHYYFMLNVRGRVRKNQAIYNGQR